MCGILFEISPVSSSGSIASEKLVKDVSRRGPDSLQSVELVVDGWKLTFTASVLALRGTTIVTQPLVSHFTVRDQSTRENGSPEYVLCWNGEAWRFDGQEFSAAAKQNDTEFIFEQLRSCDGHVQDILQKIEGPFALVLYDSLRRRVWFGRDWLGRRSLLRKVGQDLSDIAVCSIADTEATSDWDEIEADGLYYIDIPEGTGAIKTGNVGSLKTGKLPFVPQDQFLTDSTEMMRLPIPALCTSFPDSTITTPALSPESSPVQRLHKLLHDSIRLRVQNIPLHGVQLVSGEHGSHRYPKVGILFSGGLDCTMLARMAHDLLPIDEPIELLNVAFENRRVLDAAAAATRRKPKGDIENPAQASPTGVFDATYEICPDRQTGRRSWAELQAVCTGRDWRFREINVPYDEVVNHKPSIISLLHPHDTEMDLSIGMAFYFASRPLEPNAPRVLLSGLGADELFGGYARHGTAFSRAGFQGLIDELNLDLTRLGKRNLGRDDRIISSWGREVRFPFLDERLLQAVISWPVNEKCGFGVPPAGEAWDELDSEKKVLRLLAWKLGMQGVAYEKKRAIQFGARTAKMEASQGKKVKGTQKIGMTK